MVHACLHSIIFSQLNVSQYWTTRKLHAFTGKGVITETVNGWQDLCDVVWPNMIPFHWTLATPLEVTSKTCVLVSLVYGQFCVIVCTNGTLCIQF